MSMRFARRLSTIAIMLLCATRSPAPQVSAGGTYGEHAFSGFLEPKARPSSTSFKLDPHAAEKFEQALLDVQKAESELSHGLASASAEPNPSEVKALSSQLAAVVRCYNQIDDLWREL